MWTISTDLASCQNPSVCKTARENKTDLGAKE